MWWSGRCETDRDERADTSVVVDDLYSTEASVDPGRRIRRRTAETAEGAQRDRLDRARLHQAEERLFGRERNQATLDRTGRIDVVGMERHRRRPVASSSCPDPLGERNVEPETLVGRVEGEPRGDLVGRIR